MTPPLPPMSPSLPAALAILLVALTASARAQDASAHDAHLLPFGSADHTIELALGGAVGKTALRVEVAEAPAWVGFASREAEAAAADGEPVARLAFDLDRAAPVGEVGVIRLAVVGPGGSAWGAHEVRVEVAAPREVVLESARPNPSRGAAVVPFVLPAEAEVRLSVYDVLGREVAVLAEGAMPPGAHEVRVPRGLASGVYVLRLTVESAAGPQARVRRMTVAR